MEKLINLAKQKTLNALEEKHKKIFHDIEKVIIREATKGESKVVIDARQYKEEEKNAIVTAYRLNDFITEYDFSQNEIIIKW